MPKIKRRVTEYEYTCTSFIEFGKPIVQILVSYEPIKLRDIYRDYQARRMLKPIIECRETIRTYEVELADFVKLAKSKN